MRFADTGHGIDAEVRDKVFDPFFSTKGPTKGTGLGLSICYSIIKDHGGTIEIDSEKDKGTRFIIKIRLKSEDCKMQNAKLKTNTIHCTKAVMRQFCIFHFAF